MEAFLLPGILSPLLFIWIIGYRKTDERYSWHYMLAFPLFWVITYLYYDESTKYKYPKFYVISSYFSQHFNWLIQMNYRRKKYPTFNFIYQQGKHQFTINYLQVIFMTFMFAPLLFSRFFGSWKLMEDISNIICYLFHYSGSLLL